MSSARPLLALDLITLPALAILMVGALFVPVRRLLRRRAEERVRAEERAATARVLHRVRNPLQTILLHADLLMDERTASDPAARRELCEQILGEAQRMSEMLAGMSPDAVPARPTPPADQP